MTTALHEFITERELNLLERAQPIQIPSDASVLRRWLWGGEIFDYSGDAGRVLCPKITYKYENISPDLGRQLRQHVSFAVADERRITAVFKGHHVYGTLFRPKAEQYPDYALLGHYDKQTKTFTLYDGDSLDHLRPILTYTPEGAELHTWGTHPATCLFGTYIGDRNTLTARRPLIITANGAPVMSHDTYCGQMYFTHAIGGSTTPPSDARQVTIDRIQLVEQAKPLVRRLLDAYMAAASLGAFPDAGAHEAELSIAFNHLTWSKEPGRAESYLSAARIDNAGRVAPFGLRFSVESVDGFWWTEADTQQLETILMDAPTTFTASWNEDFSILVSQSPTLCQNTATFVVAHRFLLEAVVEGDPTKLHKYILGMDNMRNHLSINKITRSWLRKHIMAGLERMPTAVLWPQLDSLPSFSEGLIDKLPDGCVKIEDYKED